MAAAAGLMVITAADTGLRWGELAGPQWTRVHLDDPHPHLVGDGDGDALHELGGRLELGSPKSAASARTVNLPPLLVDLLAEHHDAHPEARFVFTGANEAQHRRANFRQRFWQPALVGNPDRGWKPIQKQMHSTTCVTPLTLPDRAPRSVFDGRHVVPTAAQRDSISPS